MKISELIAYVRGTNKTSPSSAFPDELFCIWINEIEGMVQSEILLLSPADTVTYTLPGDEEKELLVPAPHSKIYRAYVTAMMQFENGEYSSYDNSMELFNQWWREYSAWYAHNYDPASGRGEFKGYYVSAYAIAVKHGFMGTEEEWLSELDIRRAAAEAAADRAESAADDAESAVEKYPRIGEDGYWQVWNTATGEFVSTEVKAEGEPGESFAYEDLTDEQRQALVGPAGKDGSVWHNTTINLAGGPLLWIDGAKARDYCFNTYNGDVYKAGTSTWKKVGNIQGPPGEDAELTETDKAELVQAVLDSLPRYNGEVVAV